MKAAKPPTVEAVGGIEFVELFIELLVLDDVNPVDDDEDDSADPLENAEGKTVLAMMIE